MTGYLPLVSVASLLAADTSFEQCPSDALLQTWHRLRLAVLHSIWTASQIAQTNQPTQPSAASQPATDLPSPSSSHLASSPSSSSSSSASHHGHLARQLALKTVKAMIPKANTTCGDIQQRPVRKQCSKVNASHVSLSNNSHQSSKVIWQPEAQ